MRGALILAVVASSALADTRGDLRLSLGSGFDSNARRDFDRPDAEVVPVPDGVVSAIASGAGLWSGEFAQASATYDAGVRKFMRLPTEDVFIQDAAVDASVAAAHAWALGVDGRAKDRRGGDRDYTDLIGEAFIDFAPDPAVEVRVHGGAHRFLYWNRFDYAFAATELGAFARYRFDKRNFLFAFGDLSMRTFNATANPPPVDQPPPPEQRQDTLLSGGAGYTHKGPFTLSITYQYFENSSNSYGEVVMRHRLVFSAGTQLPWELTVVGQVAVQTSYFPQGIPLSEELNIPEDDDNHNSVSFKLSRAVSEHVDAELRFAYYRDDFPRSALHYERAVAAFGLTWRL